MKAHFLFTSAAFLLFLLLLKFGLTRFCNGEIARDPRGMGEWSGPTGAIGAMTWRHVIVKARRDATSS